MLAFLTRRQDTPTPDTTGQSQQGASSAVMRFLTHGGAEVHVDSGGLVTCLGCDYTHDWSSIIYGRGDANEHATDCRSMPKPPSA
ncbi:hypothetical protein [Streptomyces griseorubiginosus]|uniref:hypothetical protein n=1 Tax=Streptomyces griseorubiginosus TaxID=67304 RepID=UPI003324B879